MPVELGDTCKKGHKIEGDNAQRYTNRGAPSVRCAKCNTPPRNIPKQPGDTCKHGHVIEGDNLGRRVVSGRVQYFCNECKRRQMKKYANSDKGKVVMKSKTYDQTLKKQRQAQRKAADRADDLIKSGKEDAALAYLKLAKRAERASVALHRSMEASEPKCLDNPGPYVDYDEDNPPTKEEAYLLCVGCPVLVECARFANVYRPEVGVWGGEVYQAGRVLYK